MGLNYFTLQFRRFATQRYLQLMVIPWIIWLIVFCYIPMYGVIIAFKQYDITQGIFGGPWIGLENFYTFFNDADAVRSVYNTIGISLYKLAVGFPAPIIFALMLNELAGKKFKRFVQSVSYLPYFISWVIMVGIMQTLLSVHGPVNRMLTSTGILREGVIFLGEPELFWHVLVFSELWKNIGWSSIIYLAAIAGVNQEMYEAATVDGATRIQRMVYITIPSIMSTIVILLMLNISSVLNANFDQIFLLSNHLVADVAEVIDTYVYKQGITTGRYSYATAVGLFKSAAGVILLVIANKLARKISGGEHGLW
ncbi:MAG TPA: ABC transporter permease subunit [Bacilli bacterium]